MQVVCRSCSEVIKADNVNLDRMVAKCGECHAVFPVLVSGASAPTVKRAAIARPAGMKVTETEVGESGAFGGFAYRTNARPKSKRFELSWRWWSSKMWFFVVFITFWDGVLALIYGAAMSRGESLPLFPLIHVGVGVGLTYFVLVKIVNRSELAIDENGISLRHGPLPWPGKNRRVARTAIGQCYCQEYTSHTQNDRPISAYKVMIRTADRQHVELVKGLDSSAKALYIEQQIEDALGIEDLPVDGELPR